ncbi:hypothetical protein [Sphingobacterium faecale]|uniref:PKD family protein n=1 Tax=Sphingobacterium faecale TaxID=2803775 RepID=A0ABS1R4R3_9SPHI|nr:hypothetical protein [Sphingobacterium faecale]MBL1409500.1 hypothetical protein [Sphingobacterium faecale]
MMQRLYIFLGGMLLSMGLIFSCDYKDIGIMEVIPVSDILIDTSGIAEQQVVTSGERLKLTPPISRLGSDYKDFEYEWRLTTKPVSNFASYDIIGRGPALDKEIERMPSSDPYRLWLVVTDKSTGLIGGVIWTVMVEAPIKQGLVVADSEDGQYSDLSIIQDTLFTLDWRQVPSVSSSPAKPTEIKRNEFSRVHGKKIDGIIHSLFSQRLYQEGVYQNFLHGASATDIFRINTIDYGIVAQGKKLFYDESIKLDIVKYFQSSSVVWLSNGGKASVRQNERDNTIGYNRFGVDRPGNYYLNKHIAIHPTTGSWAVFYDETQGKFLKLGASTDVKSPPADCGLANEHFNPKSLPGYKVLGGGLGSSTEVRFVLKKDDYYGIFILTRNNASDAKRKIDISNAPNIDKAVAFVFPTDQAVIYYATPTKVYSIRMAQGEPTTYTDLYTSLYPLTGLEMLRRSGTRAVPNSERCLLAISYDGAEGRITTLPIPASGLGLGIVEANKAVTFGGFKKISAVAVQE